MSTLSCGQAARGMTVALFLGLGLTAVEVAWSVSRERGKAEQVANEIMDLLDGAATVAVWTFDPDLGNRVAQDALTLNAVRSFTLMHESGDVMAASRRGSGQDSLLGMMVFGDLVVVERQLFRPAQTNLPASDDGSGEPTGLMRIQLDAAVISADLWAFMGNSLIGGIVRNLLLGLALTVVFNRYLTRPLVQLGREIDLIDPARPEQSTVNVPPGHVRDELGAIALRVNALLRRLAAVQSDLRRLSTRDPLTRLANRALYEEGLSAALVRARRNGQELAVMLVQVRPEALARVGDDAVQHVATRLRDCVRTSDLVARLGSGEFAAVLADTDAGGAMRIADRVISGLAHGIAVGDQRIDNTPWIGIALYPSEDTEPEALTVLARIAAARAAATGVPVQFVTETLTGIARAHMEQSDALLGALEQDKVVLVYQPAIDVASGNVRGLVAIPTWTYDGRTLQGADLVGFAREIGLDMSLMDTVLRASAQALASLDLPWPLIVRCVDRQLGDPGFIDLVRQLQREHAVPDGGLALLVSQSSAELPENLHVLSALRTAGVPLWLDVKDPERLRMGAMTRRLFTGIEFPALADEVPDGLAPVLRLAQDLGMDMAARNVESPAQWAALVRAGCRQLRGPALARAVPVDALPDMLGRMPARPVSGTEYEVEPGPTQ